jgi:hypothetical protein
VHLIFIPFFPCRLDDPMVWGIMPFSTYFDTSKVRWTLGAADILFTNRWVPSVNWSYFPAWLL